MKGPLHYEWPITWRFQMLCPWGATQQELTVDAPAMKESLETSSALGGELWGGASATAMSTQVELVNVDTVCWRFIGGALPRPIFGRRGFLHGQPTARSDSACLLLMSGHDDRRSVRRFFVPCIPERWVDDGLLVSGARSALEAMCQAMIMGLCGQLVGGPMVWLIDYRNALDPSSANPDGVGFRTVEHVGVGYHTEPAPVPSSGPWP